MVEALGGGDVAKAISLFEPHYAEKLSVAGTPEEVAATAGSHTGRFLAPLLATQRAEDTPPAKKRKRA